MKSFSGGLHPKLHPICKNKNVFAVKLVCYNYKGQDSKSRGGNSVSVRFRPPAPVDKTPLILTIIRGLFLPYEIYASIAQLVERRSRKAQASGSIPLAGSNKIKALGKIIS